jgi:hypothetical protein
MADVVLTYAHDDRQVAKALAEDLAARGYQVWWDADLVAGDDYRQVILAELNSAAAIIVIWSPASVKSRFVCDEADHALSQSKLIATRTADLALSAIPLGFKGLHSILVSEPTRIAQALARVGITPGGSRPEKAAPAPPAAAVRGQLARQAAFGLVSGAIAILVWGAVYSLAITLAFGDSYSAFNTTPSSIGLTYAEIMGIVGAVCGVAFALAEPLLPRNHAFWMASAAFGAFALTLVDAAVTPFTFASSTPPLKVLCIVAASASWGLSVGFAFWLWRRRERAR